MQQDNIRHAVLGNHGEPPTRYQESVSTHTHVFAPNSNACSFSALLLQGVAFVLEFGNIEMASASDLEAQLACLKRKEAALKAEAKMERKKQKRSHGDHHIAKVLCTAGLAQVAPKLAKPLMLLVSDLVILYELSEFCDEAVVSYILGLGRPSRFQGHGFTDMWDAGLRSNISAGFGLVYQSLDVPFLVANLANCAAKRLEALCKYIIEHKLFHWMVKNNCEQGVAPPILQLLLKAAQFIPVLAPLVIRDGLKQYFTKFDSTSYQWAASFRERWGLHGGVLGAGEDVEPELLRAKVAHS